MKNHSYKYTAVAVKWFDKINGNTYHSVRVIRHSDREVLVCSFQYGYGEQYRHTALSAMLENKWIPLKYMDNLWSYERENGYPIIWIEYAGSKRECKAHGGN